MSPSSPPNATSADSELGESARPQITGRAVVLGLLTIVATFYYIVNVGQRLGVGSYVHAQLPMAVFMPFVLWLLAGVVLQRAWPSRSLRQGELLTIFTMLWVVGTIPQLGWMNYWVNMVTSPSYFATPENQWAETFFDYLPWHVFLPASQHQQEVFWFGLPEGMAIPWDLWVGVLGQWLGVSLGMVVFGFCTVVLFQRQWVDGEKLPFPLAQVPLDLTRGFDGGRRLPDTFRSLAFWSGFAIVFLPILHNIATYFIPGLPLVELYWKHYQLDMGNGVVLYFRVMPLVMMVTYLCPVDILGTLVGFHLLAAVKEGAMRRVGFTVGASGQQIDAREILYLESYGALVFLALWSVWLARRHLGHVWSLVRTGRGEAADVVRYRLAVGGMVLSGSWVVYWAMSLGMSLPLALGAFLLTAMVYFVTIKLIAATGFAYLLPNKTHIKGETFFVDLLGSAHLSPRGLVAYKILASEAFFGTFRIPAWPAIAHHLRIFSLERQPRWVVAVVFLAFPVGFLVAATETIGLAYGGGGRLFLGDKMNWVFDEIARLADNPTHTDLGKWAVFLGGWGEAALVAWCRTRLHWFPLHPIGLAFQWTFGIWLYWFSLTIVWLVKLTLLRYGGVRAFRSGKPLFYGIGIGYVAGNIVSVIVDLVWFPGEGHRMHGW